jgi:hypothetical protein
MMRWAAAAGIGVGLAVLLWRPGEWVLTIHQFVPNVPLLAWIAGNAALWVVIGFWILDFGLLRNFQNPKSKIQNPPTL